MNDSNSHPNKDNNTYVRIFDKDNKLTGKEVLDKINKSDTMIINDYGNSYTTDEKATIITLSSSELSSIDPIKYLANKIGLACEITKKL